MFIWCLLTALCAVSYSFGWLWCCLRFGFIFVVLARVLLVVGIVWFVLFGIAACCCLASGGFCILDCLFVKVVDLLGLCLFAWLGWVVSTCFDCLLCLSSCLNCSECGYFDLIEVVLCLIWVWCDLWGWYKTETVVWFWGVNICCGFGWTFICCVFGCLVFVFCGFVLV